MISGPVIIVGMSKLRVSIFQLAASSPAAECVALHTNMWLWAANRHMAFWSMWKLTRPGISSGKTKQILWNTQLSIRYFTTERGFLPFFVVKMAVCFGSCPALKVKSWGLLGSPSSKWTEYFPMYHIAAYIYIYFSGVPISFTKPCSQNCYGRYIQRYFGGGQEGSE